MSSVQSLCSKLVFSTFLVAVLLKVPKITDALPLADLCKLSGLSIDGSDLANLDIPRLLFQAADTPKKSAADKIKEVGEEVVEKIKEFYDLLAESELVQEEDEIENVDADDTAYLAPRGVETEKFSVQDAIANEVRQKEERQSEYEDAVPDFDSDDTAPPKFEFEPSKTATPEFLSDKPAAKLLDPDKPTTESEFTKAADSTIVSEPESPNAGDKFKQMTVDTAQKVHQFVKENIKKSGDGIKMGTGQAIRTLKRIYNERIKAPVKYDPETGEPLVGNKKKGIRQAAKQFIQDNIKNPILKFLNFKVQLDVNVKPIS